jgi:hypothetical protein
LDQAKRHDRGDNYVRIRKKLFAVASTVALTAGLSVVTALPAHAAGPPAHNAANDSVTCNDLLGKIKFSIPLRFAGTTANDVSLTIKSDDCVDTTAGLYDPDTNTGGVTLAGAIAKGIIHSDNNDCQGLQGLSTTAGSVPFKWKTVAKGIDPDGIGPLKAPIFPKLVDATSTLSISGTWGGSYGDGGDTSPTAATDSWGAQYGFFAIGAAASGLPVGSGQSYTPAPSVTGSFTGGDGGAKTTFQGVTTQTVGALANACFGTTGIKGIVFGIGGVTLT